MQIYTMNLSVIYLIVIGGILLWTLADKYKTAWFVWKIISFIGVFISLYAIFSYTVLNRTPSDIHQFTIFADIGNEFYREMLMNAFLYYPLGLTASVFIGPWVVLIGFVISVSIETWQYITGSGLAQGTDVIMNTLGTAVGSIPWVLVRFGVAKKAVVWGKKVFHRIQEYLEKQRKY